MKKLIFTALLGVGLLFAGNAYSQNAIIGDGFAGGWDINNEAEWRFFSQGVEETRIRITHANAAGNQFFRLVRGFRTDPESRKTQFQPASGLDTEYAIGSKIAPSTGKTGKFFINVSDVNNNYVFKTPAAGVNDGDARFVVFEVQGEIREVTDLTRSSSTVYRSQEIGITATTDGSLSAGQAVYLRYSSDDFATSTIVEMTGSGSTYNSVIPSSANTSGANISYYAFTSGTGLIIPNADADLFSINRLMDASYSYNVQDTYVTAQAGNWSNGNTWAAGSVPPSKSRVVIDHDVTLNQNVTVVEFTLNNGVTFTASDANPRNLTVFKGTSGDHVTFTINGTWDNGNGGSTVIFTGGTLFPQTGNARHLIRGSGASLDNIVVNRSQGSYRVGVKFGTGFSVINKFRLANDGIISEQLPSGFYGQDAILEFNDGSGNTRNINADNPAWSATQVPNRIRIMSGKLLLNSWKSFSGLLTIENGAEFDVNGNGNGQLTMQPNASIINHGTISGSTIIYQRTFAGHTRWAMVSSPAKNGAIAGANGLFQNNQIWTQGFEGSSLPGSSAPNVRFFNESVVNPAGGMRYLAPTGANFESGRGYIAYMYRLTDVNDTDSGIDFGNTVFSQTGAVNTFTGGEFSIPVSYTDGQGNGWNLVGNPFPSYLEWNSDNWNRSNVGNYFYVWNPTTNEYQARTFNNDFIAGTGAGAAGEDVGDLGTNLIAPFQGFWVRATGSSPTLTVQAAAQSATSTPFLSRSVELPRITFHAEAEDSRQSMTSLFFSDDASAGIDVNDAFQLTPLTDSYISLFTKVEEESMLINNLPSSFETIETPMYAVAVHEGSYSSEPISLTWSFSSALPEDMSVELVDMVTGDVIDVLNTSEYQFNLDAPMSKERPSREVTPLITTTSDARFMLKVNLGESTSVDVAAELPSEVSLSQNYPNPFNPTTTIQFAIPSSIEAGSTVRLSVFDMLGREVAVLINEARPAGNHTVSFDASALGSGVYVYRLQAGSVVQTRKMTLIK